MVPLFPITVTDQRNSQPITIQKLVPTEDDIQPRFFKHLPAEQLRATAARARADHQLEETTRALLRTLSLEPRPPAPLPADAAGRYDASPHKAPDKTESDSEALGESLRRKCENDDSVRQIPTASTLLSEQGTQTAAARGSFSVGAAPLPSLQLLRTLQHRLVDALQHISELRSHGPWQERVVDQPDWNRKLARMEEFHTNVTRQMYVLSRQVDLIVDTMSSVPERRLTTSLKGDVIRKLVRAHRSALRVVQAFAQNYWDGALDGRPAARFLEALSVCRRLLVLGADLGVPPPDTAHLPERLAAAVEQHVTRGGDVGALIRAMAHGRFGAAADSQRRARRPAPGRPAARPRHRLDTAAQGLGFLRHSQSTVLRQSSQPRQSVAPRQSLTVRQERGSVRSAPAGRRRLRPVRVMRPGSAPQPPAAAAAARTQLPRQLPPLREETAADSGSERPPDTHDQGGGGSDVPAEWQGTANTAALTALVQETVSRALAAAPVTTGRHGSPVQGTGRREGRHRSPDQVADRREGWHGSPARREGRHGSPDQAPGRREGRHRSPDQTPGRREGRHGSPDRREGRHGSPDQAPDRREGRHSSPGRWEGRQRSPDQTPGRRKGRHRSPDQAVRRRRHGGELKGHRADAAAAAPVSRRLRQLQQRLQTLQQRRDVIRRRWLPLLQARNSGAEPETVWGLGAACSVADCGTDPGAGATVPVSANAAVAHLAPLTSLQPTSERPRQVTSPHQPQALVAPSGPAAVCREAARDRPAAQHTSGAHRQLAPTDRQLTPADRHLRDLFVAEAIDPELKSSIVAEIRTAVDNSSDADIKRLPESTLHQLLNEFISEAGVDIFLHQLFNQEFDLQ